MEQELPPYRPGGSRQGQSAEGQSPMGFQAYRGNTQPPMNEGMAQEQFADLFKRKQNGEQLGPEEEKILEYAMQLWERDRMGDQGSMRQRASSGSFVHPSEQETFDRVYEGSPGMYGSKEDMYNARPRRP